MGDCSKIKKKFELLVINVGYKRKFFNKWKEEFSWLIFSEENNIMICSICF